MTNKNSSSSTLRSEKGEGTRRTSEVDQFVDQILSMMCDRTRRQIIELLSVPAGAHQRMKPASLERRSTDIAKALGLSPATTSEHLRQLAQTKLLASRRAGNTVYYRLSNDRLMRAFRDLIQ